jgi:succinate dehydrogenase/fumarate reductase flavoprotein subunit
MDTTKTIVTDVLVIGGGGAAARAGFEASALGVDVTMVDKGTPGRSGTSPLCLHGLCAPISLEDSPYAFFEDWKRVGCGMGDENLIWESVIGAPANVLQLIQAGVDFAKEGGKYHVYRGAGHSRPRGLTVKYSRRGSNLITVLAGRMRKQGGRILDGILITRLLKRSGAVTGALGIDSRGDFHVFKAKAVVLACGGANRIFSHTPAWIRDEQYRTTGDAFSLAFYAGATIIDLEFANFRESPPGASRTGGRYLNARGERFMERYDPVALEKAPRQVTVAAIYTEMKEGRGPITWYVDEEALKRDPAFSVRFPGRKRLRIGIDFQRLLGGVRINEKAETELPHLYAAGESAGGLHGADRMQGNGFLDTQIFGARAGYHAAKLALNTGDVALEMDQVEEEIARIKAIRGRLLPSRVIKEIQETMWENAGIVRSAKGLEQAMKVISGMKRDQILELSGKSIFSALECANLLLTAEMIVHAATKREESRGSHRRGDFPGRNDTTWQRHIALRNANGGIASTTIPVVPLSR